VRSAARQLLHVAVVAAVAAAAGCMGGDSDYGLDPTRECLSGADVRVDTREIDVVASTAPGGALHATFPGNEVTVSFGGDVDDAARMERAYRRFANPSVRPRLDHVLKRRRNAVMIWGVAPAPADESRVVGCLSA
jgi:hypothetical protein